MNRLTRSIVPRRRRWLSRGPSSPQQEGMMEKGVCGFEFRMRVDVPLDELRECLVGSGYEATPKRLARLIDVLQETFSDKHGGCKAEEVYERILGQAALIVADWTEDGILEDEEGESSD